MSSSQSSRTALWLVPLLLGLLASGASAQQSTGAVGGVVRSADGTALRGVELLVEGTDRHTLSAVDGAFMLTRVPAGAFTLTARSIGYAPVSRRIDVIANRLTRIEISLSEAAVELSAITVLGVRRYGANTSQTGMKFDANVLDVPQSVVVISEDFMQDQNATYLDDILRNVGGVTPFSEYQDFTARGFRQGEDEVTYNGVKSNPYNFFATPTMHNVERVEVLKGPASVLYGAAEGGALINVVTKSPRAIPTRAFSLTAGSYSKIGGSADLTGPLMGENLLYRITGHYDNSESFRRFQETTDWHIAPSLTWVAGPRTSVTAKAEWIQDERKGQRNRGIGAPNGDLDLLPVSWTSNEPTDVAGNDGWTADLGFEHGFSANWRAAGNVRYSVSEYTNSYHESQGFECSIGNATSATLLATCVERGGRILMRRQYRDQLFDWKTLAWTGNINGSLNTASINHRLLLNADLMSKKKLTSRNDYANSVRSSGGVVTSLDILNPVYNADPDTYAGINPVDNPFGLDYWDWGISAQDLITIIPQIKVVLGGRYNNFYRKNFNLRTNTSDEYEREAYTYRAGLVLQPLQWVSVFGNYSEGFKPQNNSEDDRGGPFDPLITVNSEGGVKFSLFGDRLVASSSAYRITKQNILVPDLDPETNILIQLGEVRSQGWEVDFVGSIMKNWSVTANFARNDTRTTEDTRVNVKGARFPNAPRKAAAFWSRYDFMKLNLGIALGVSNVGERRTFDAIMLPEYTAIDGALFYTWRNYQLAVNLKNLKDDRYFTGGYNSYQLWPAAPRSVNVTLRATY